MKIRSAAAVVAAALVVGSLAACSSSGGSGNSAKITLTFSSYAWQVPTVRANHQIVASWNKSHPDIQVKYEPVNPDSVHDKLVAQFNSHSAPDIIHDEAADIAGFAQQGFLADMTNLIPSSLKNDVPKGVWDSVTFGGKVYGAPSLLQSYLPFVNKKALAAAGIQLPTESSPWTWDQFAAAAKKLSGNGKYGLAWGLQSPVSTVVSLSLNFGGTWFSGSGTDAKMTFGPAEQQVPTRIRAMIANGSIAPQTIGMSGTDVLPGFFAGKYAMFVGGNYVAQQMAQQAPKGFEWTMLPPLKGTSQNQFADPQTYSIARQSQHPKEAMEFIDYFLSKHNLAAVAQGDWLAPATNSAAQQVLANTKGANSWDTVIAATKDFVADPTAPVTNYPQWKDEIATPALQQYFAGKISLSELGSKLSSGWQQVNSH